MTSEAAWQLFSDEEIGSIEPGKFADFVILDKDPRAVPVDALRDIGVAETWMDGRRVLTR
jgi:predicted amidohydrolase YtcJ